MRTLALALGVLGCMLSFARVARAIPPADCLLQCASEESSGASLSCCTSSHCYYSGWAARFVSKGSHCVPKFTDAGLAAIVVGSLLAFVLCAFLCCFLYSCIRTRLRARAAAAATSPHSKNRHRHHHSRHSQAGATTATYGSLA